MRASHWLPSLSIFVLALGGGWSCSGTDENPDGSIHGQDGNTGDDSDTGDDIDPTRLCPPEAGLVFNATCAEAVEPDWIAQGDRAVWEEADGTLKAVATATALEATSLSRSQAANSASALLLAHLQGVPPSDGDCLVESWVEGDLLCAEIPAFYWAEGTRWALALRPGNLAEVGCPVPDPILNANCPAPPTLAHQCDCIAPQQPTWMEWGLFRPGDGYVYATGIAPAADPAERARNRAAAELTNYFFGATIQAGPDGEACIVSSRSSDAAFGRSYPDVEQICDRVLGEERYVLIRSWMGPPQ